MWEHLATDPYPTAAQRRFLDEHPAPSAWQERDDVAWWLDEVADKLGAPTMVAADLPLPGDERPGQDQRLTVGVVSWSRSVAGDTHILAGLDKAAVERDLAGLIMSRIGTAAPIPAPAWRPDLDDPEAVSAWLGSIDCGGPFTFSVQQTSLAGLPYGPTPPEPVPARLTSGAGRVVISTERASDWAALDQGGIPDLLISAFPPEPDPADHPGTDGTTAEDNYMEAVQDWMDECLDLAADVANIGGLRERLARLEQMRDGLARHLGELPLPAEPDPSQYGAVAPAYEGEVDRAAFTWAKQEWALQFQRTALIRDAFLEQLLATSATTAPEQSQTGCPAATPGRPQAAVTLGYAVTGPGTGARGPQPWTCPPPVPPSPGLGL